MNLRNITRASLMLIAITACISIFYSCKKNTVYTGGNQIGGTVFNNSATTQASIGGQVIDENGNPLSGVEVKVGTHTYITGPDGGFYFSKITTPQHAALVTASKDQFMHGYRTLLITPNKDHFAKIMMIELKNASTFNSITGGTVNVNGGGSIKFQGNGVVYKSNGTPYNGTVTVYSKWLDPTSDAVRLLMPGDLRGVDANDIEKVLQTYGMMAVELFDNSNQPLQLASGKSATLTSPIPAALQSKAPSTIPLWYFDAGTGMWEEEGSATKQGSNYVGDVKHFSFWNYDTPFPAVLLDMTLTDNASIPLSNMLVRITYPSTGQQGYGITNGAGFVSGMVPSSATLLVEVIIPPCNMVLYSQTITTGTTPLSLGTILVTIPSANLATVSGVVKDCSGNPVSSGYVSILHGSELKILPTSPTGTFNIGLPLCVLPISSDITAYDLSANVHDQVTVTLNSGLNPLGTLIACSTMSQFVNITSTVGSIPTSFSITEPTGDFSHLYSAIETWIYSSDSLGATNSICQFKFDGLDNTTSAHTLVTYNDHLDMTSTPNPGIPVNLSLYQPIGGFVQGDFIGVVTGSIIPSRTIDCSFRVKRN